MKHRAFTLVELLVVIAIIGLLSTVALIATKSARMNAHNAQIKANLMQISKALELYYNAKDGYPKTTGYWWGEESTFGNHGLSGSSGYIPDLAPTYMASLPHDPNTGKANPNSPSANCQNPAFAAAITGYIYWSDGVDYKVAADCLPEGSVTTDPFYDSYSGGQGFSVYTPGAKTWW